MQRHFWQRYWQLADLLDLGTKSSRFYHETLWKSSRPKFRILEISLQFLKGIKELGNGCQVSLLWYCQRDGQNFEAITKEWLRMT